MCYATLPVPGTLYGRLEVPYQKLFEMRTYVCCATGRIGNPDMIAIKDKKKIPITIPEILKLERSFSLPSFVVCSPLMTSRD
jgi:hypothetical protein